MPLSQMILAMLTVVALHQQIAAADEIRKPRLDLLGDPLPQEALARMGSGRLRHFGPGHRSILFSPDSKQLLSSGHEDLRIWDTATGKLQRRFDVALSHNGASCRFVGDSIVCASANVSGGKWAATVQVLDAATGQVRRRVRIEEQAFTINPPLSPDGKRLAVALQNEIRLYDTATGKAVQSIPVQSGAAWSIAFAPDGKSLAFNDLSDTIYLHNTASGKLIRKLKQSGDTTLHVVFSPDGRFLASMPQSRLANKGQISIWDMHEGKELQRWTHPFPHAMSAVFSPDGKRVAIGGARWGLVLRDVETSKEIRRLSPQGGIFGKRRRRRGISSDSPPRRRARTDACLSAAMPQNCSRTGSQAHTATGGDAR